MARPAGFPKLPASHVPTAARVNPLAIGRLTAGDVVVVTFLSVVTPLALILFALYGWNPQQ